MSTEQATEIPIATGQTSLTVLIVDDEETLRRSLAEGLSLLSNDKYEPVCVASVAEALALLSEKELAAVVTDLRMPDKDGLQLLLEMRRKSLNVPTVVMTAYGSPSVHAQAAKRGAVRYIEKPFQLEELIEFLDEITGEPERPLKRSSMDIIEVVELLCIGNKDMGVVARTLGEQGKVYIQGGEIVHAEFRKLRGTKALFELFGRIDAHISTNPELEPDKITINQPWQELTEEAWRRRTMPRFTPIRLLGDKEPTDTDITEAGVEESLPLPPWGELPTETVVSSLARTLELLQDPVILTDMKADEAPSILRTAGHKVARHLGFSHLLGCVQRKPESASAVVPLDAAGVALGECSPHCLVEEQLLELSRQLVDLVQPTEEEATPKVEDLSQEEPQPGVEEEEGVETVAAKHLRSLPDISGVVVADANGRILDNEDGLRGDELGGLTVFVLNQAAKVGKSLALGSVSHVTVTVKGQTTYLVSGARAVAAMETTNASTSWPLAENAIGILSVI
jgi:FixJ family two-component response regulator